FQDLWEIPDRTEPDAVRKLTKLSIYRSTSIIESKQTDPGVLVMGFPRISTSKVRTDYAQILAL
ncbi:MAG TPA: hypothetical protein PKD55_11275, partial [Bellilinea sp.]|nr:hypothetical protein [Bellilinea sp.]